MRSEEQISDCLNRVQERIDKGGSRWRGMTYEQGVEAAIRWITEESDEHPYEED